MTTDNYFGSETRYRLFTGMKYLVYLLLSFNVYLFLQEEVSAVQHTFAGDLQFEQIIQAFAATIDTAAWVILLLLFELETSVLDDSMIRGAVKWGLHGTRGICTVAIVYAFSGYCRELITLYNVEALSIGDLCQQVDQGYSLLLGMDKYALLDAANCKTLGAQVYQLKDFDIIADSSPLQSVRSLAWTDVINSASWLLVVIVLEIEVRMQLRGDLSDKVMDVARTIKLILYFVLFAAAAYWGYAGNFLDFWDAFLWLFAFIFIELNVFEWHFETTHKEALS
ncbi:MAG: hypothetical protein HOC23_17845 [Halieaceae bacterium]|jgi:hypothetical protein|nr:hypothetical protein [Halieaceae bacterium]